MLDVVEPVNRDYCRNMGYDYKRWDGIKIASLNPFPFYATTNRVYLIEEELSAGEYDWLLYIDADAVVIDLFKPLDQFLDSSRAIVACRGGDNPEHAWWDLNNGVTLFNLRHPLIHSVLRLWRSEIESMLASIEADQLEVGWDTLPDVQLCDQAHLHRVLQQLGERELCKIYTGDEYNVFNYDGPFIRQVLRTEGTSLNERIDSLRAIVETYAPTLLPVTEHTGSSAPETFPPTP